MRINQKLAEWLLKKIQDLLYEGAGIEGEGYEPYSTEFRGIMLGLEPDDPLNPETAQGMWVTHVIGLLIQLRGLFRSGLGDYIELLTDEELSELTIEN